MLGRHGCTISADLHHLSSIFGDFQPKFAPFQQFSAQFTPFRCNFRLRFASLHSTESISSLLLRSGGMVVGESESNANFSFKLEVEVEAELGKKR